MEVSPLKRGNHPIKPLITNKKAATKPPLSRGARGV